MDLKDSQPHLLYSTLNETKIRSINIRLVGEKMVERGLHDSNRSIEDEYFFAKIAK